VLTLRSGNGIFSQPDRQAIAAELEQIRNQVLDLMNTQNASGDFIFSGYQSEKQAFEFNPSDSDKPVKFMGDGGTNSIQISDSVSIQSTSSGKVIFEDVNARLNFKVSNGAALGDIRIGNQGTFDTFHKANFDSVTGANNQFKFSIDSANQISVMNVGTGNVVEILPFTPGQMTTFKGIELNISGNPGDSLTLDLNPPEKQNIAQTLHKMVQALNDPNLSSQDFASMIDDTLVGIDNGLNKMARENASIGARLNIAESVKSNLLDSEVTNESARSAIRDVDLIKASSDLTRQEIGLEAAFASFSRVSKLSLFNFL
jgi:flagellar hook-associated protein 3 FlgL